MPLIKSTLKIGNTSATGHDHITIEGEFVGNLVPNTTSTYNLGEASKVWNNLYIANIHTNIPNKQVVYSNGGVLTGDTKMVFNSGTNRLAVGSSGNYGTVSAYSGSSQPYLDRDDHDDYQLNAMGHSTIGYSSGLSFGNASSVSASIIQRNTGNFGQGDLIFYTKEDNTSHTVDPQQRVIMKYDGRVIIGDWYGGTTSAKLSVVESTLNPLDSLTTVSNYHLGLYGNANVGGAMGLSFGTVTLVGSAIVHKNTGVNNEGELAFHTNHAGTVSEKMVIKSDGKIGIGLNDPSTDLEVEGTIGVSGQSHGGELEFRLNGNNATNTQELGRIRFGNDLATQGSIYGVASENWVANSARGTNVVISGTATGSTSESPIAIFDPTETYFNSPVNVGSSVTALTFNGNGANLTNIAKGSPTQMQYNDNNAMAGAAVYYEGTTGKVTVGAGSGGFSSRFLIHDSALNVYTNVADISNYHLYLSGSSTNTHGTGIGFGKDSSGVGASIIYQDTGSWNKGELAFLTKSSTTSGAAPVERVRIHGSGIDVKGDVATYGGKVGFKNGVNYPQANATIGLVTFGSPIGENTMIRGGVPSSWSTASRETDLSFWITKNGQTTWSEVAIMDQSGLTVNGDVEADYFIGDGSQLTNLPIPSAQGTSNAVQYNNGGVFGGSNVYYFNNNGGLSIGYNAHTIGGGLTVFNNTLNPVSSAGNMASHHVKILGSTTTGQSTSIGIGSANNVGVFIMQANTNSQNQSELLIGVKDTTVQGDAPTAYLQIGSGLNKARKPLQITDTSLIVHASPNSDEHHLTLKGSNSNGEGSSIGFGATNKTAQIATVNTNSNGYGDLLFRVKENTTIGGSLTEYLRLGGLLAQFNKRVQVTDLSIDPENASHGAHQLELKGDPNRSSGISLGTSNGVSWSITATPENATSRRGTLKFRYPNSTYNSHTSFNGTSALSIREDGHVGIHEDNPPKDFSVTGDTLFNKSGGAYTYWRNDTSYPIAGQPIGTLNFGTDIGENQAYFEVTTLGNWSSSIKGTQLKWFATPSTSNTPQNIYTWYNKHYFYGLTEFDNTIIVNGGASFVGNYTVSGYKFTASNSMTTEDLTVNDDATISGDLMMGWSSDINCNRYYYRGTLTSTLEKKIEFSDASVVVSNSDFYVLSATNQKTLFVDASPTYGRVLIGTVNGTPAGANFLAGQDATGLYVEGYGIGGHDTTADTDGGYQATESSVMTVCNRYQSNTQVVMDVLAGSGVYDNSTINNPTNYTNWTTSSTSFIRFLNKNKITSNGSQSAGVPKRVGRIRGNGSGGVAFTTSFTGMHATVTELKTEHKVGMIMVSTGEMWIKAENNIETCLPRTAPTSTPKDKRVFGVLGELEPEFEGYSANTPPRENESQVQVYSIGEGGILVTNINGNIENGDYICSSEILGHGMLQDDDLLHSYTVAKCTETINWDDSELETIEHKGQTYKAYMMSCTYHCG